MKAKSIPFISDRTGFLKSCITIVMKILRACSLSYIIHNSEFCASLVIRTSRIEFEETCPNLKLCIFYLVLSLQLYSLLISSEALSEIILFDYSKSYWFSLLNSSDFCFNRSLFELKLALFS